MFLPVIEPFTKWLFWLRFRLTLHTCTTDRVLLYHRESWRLIPSHTCLGNQRGGEMWIATEIGGRDGILEFFEKNKKEKVARGGMWYDSWSRGTSWGLCDAAGKTQVEKKRRRRGHEYGSSVFRERTSKKIIYKKTRRIKRDILMTKTATPMALTPCRNLTP